MAKKNANIFVCQNCGTSYPKWQGKCDSCGEWNTIVEEVSQSEGFSKIGGNAHAKKIEFVPLKGDMETYARLKTGIKEIDRVSGGGLVPGSVVLVGGDPGIGKSTILLQTSGELCKNGKKVLYVSAEESASQLKLRADRLGINSECAQYCCYIGKF